MKTKLEIRIKGGIILPAGLDCEIREINGHESGVWRCFIQHESRPEKPYQVRIESAFRAPSIATLEKWSEEGICKAISGAMVEMDGICENGTPSWFLALGMI